MLGWAVLVVKAVLRLTVVLSTSIVSKSSSVSDLALGVAGGDTVVGLAYDLHE